MAKSHGSVRIGPLSILSLIIILCLAVMAVLALSTAKAELGITNHQSRTVQETYNVQYAGEMFLSRLDATLGTYRGENSTLNYSYSTMLEAVDNTLGTYVEAARETIDELECSASMQNNVITADFTSPLGRNLHAVVVINDDGTYTCTDWQISTAWELENNDVLWTGEF